MIYQQPRREVESVSTTCGSGWVDPIMRTRE
jgi:hypothetical protein